MSHVITLNPVSNNHTIQPRKHFSEFEVQSYVYQGLLNLGIKAQAELSHYGDFGLRKTKVSCRFDIVIFDKNDNAIHIVEVKPHVVKHKTCVDDTLQTKKYRSFGVPLTYIYGMDGAIEFIANYPG